MTMKTLLLASCLAGLVVGPALAQTSTPPDGPTPIPVAGDGTTGTGGTTTPPSTTASFDKLSSGNQKIARSLFEAQGSATGDGSALSLNEIAGMKSGTGWGQVFKQMQTQGQLVGAKNLGQVVSGHYQPPAPVTPPPATGTDTGTGATTGTTPASGTTTTSGTGTTTGSSPTTAAAGYSRTAARPVAITTGSGRTVMVGAHSGTSAAGGHLAGGDSHGRTAVASGGANGITTPGNGPGVTTTAKANGQGSGKGPAR
jgi:hypothetical protein